MKLDYTKPNRTEPIGSFSPWECSKHNQEVPVVFAGLLSEQRESNKGGFASCIFSPVPDPSPVIASCSLFGCLLQ